MIEFLCNDCGNEWAMINIGVCPECKSDNIEEVYIEDENWNPPDNKI